MWKGFDSWWHHFHFWLNCFLSKSRFSFRSLRLSRNILFVFFSIFLYFEEYVFTCIFTLVQIIQPYFQAPDASEAVHIPECSRPPAGVIPEGRWALLASIWTSSKPHLSFLWQRAVWFPDGPFFTGRLGASCKRTLGLDVQWLMQHVPWFKLCFSGWESVQRLSVWV